ncbi:MAG: HAMP domain-containing histidine kinase, partial [Chitinophagaceae bacterium]
STDIDDQKKTMEAMEQIQEALSHYNKELSQKNQELRQTNSDLDNFIYTASHDLKAPISNIEGLLDLLKSEVKTDSELTARVFGLMEKSIVRFKNTLKDLTDISSTDRQTDTVSQVHLPDLMDEVEADIDLLIKESKASIRFSFAVNDLLYSRKNMRSILYNLLSNALKYRSPERIPEIEVCSRQLTGTAVEITVKDNGLGLDEKDTERVFEMFRRAHSHVEGSGVGLYIVKRIVENSGGSISVKSTLGKGTVFTVLLNQ